MSASARSTGPTRSSSYGPNFPSKGRGQAADHFVIDEQARVRLTEMIPASRSHGLLDRRPQGTGIVEQNEGRDWLDIGADHTPIAVYLTVQQPAATAT